MRKRVPIFAALGGLVISLLTGTGATQAASNTTGILAYSAWHPGTGKAQIFTRVPDGEGGYIEEDPVCVTCELDVTGGRRPEWAPGGNKIAYMVPGNPNSNIWTLQLDATGRPVPGSHTQMTGGTTAWPGEDCCPWFSRDGSKIFFHSRGASTTAPFQIYSMPASTGCVNNDTTCATNYSNDTTPFYAGTVSASWGNSTSPTYNKLIYRSNCGGTIAAPIWPNCTGGGNSIWWLDTAGTGPSYNKTMVLDAGGCSGSPLTCNSWLTPTFGPKGNNFFVVKQNSLAIGGTPTFATVFKYPILANGSLGTPVDATAAPAGEFHCNPQGSRDGSYIFYALSDTRCDFSGTTPLGTINSVIYRIPVNGGTAEPISNQPRAIELAESP